MKAISLLYGCLLLIWIVYFFGRRRQNLSYLVFSDEMWKRIIFSLLIFGVCLFADNALALSQLPRTIENFLIDGNQLPNQTSLRGTNEILGLTIAIVVLLGASKLWEMPGLVVSNSIKSGWERIGNWRKPTFALVLLVGCGIFLLGIIREPFVFEKTWDDEAELYTGKQVGVLQTSIAGMQKHDCFLCTPDLEPLENTTEGDDIGLNFVFGLLTKIGLPPSFEGYQLFVACSITGIILISAIMIAIGYRSEIAGILFFLFILSWESITKYQNILITSYWVPGGAAIISGALALAISARYREERKNGKKPNQVFFIIAFVLWGLVGGISLLGRSNAGYITLLSAIFMWFVMGILSNPRVTTINIHRIISFSNWLLISGIVITLIDLWYYHQYTSINIGLVYYVLVTVLLIFLGICLFQNFFPTNKLSHALTKFVLSWNSKLIFVLIAIILVAVFIFPIRIVLGNRYAFLATPLFNMGSGVIFLGVIVALIGPYLINNQHNLTHSESEISTKLLNSKTSFVKNIRHMSLLVVFLLGFIIPVLAFRFALDWRIEKYNLQEVNPRTRTSHAFIHNFYIGLGYVENKWGITWNDKSGFSQCPEAYEWEKHLLLGNDYYDCIRERVMHVLIQDPILLVKNLIIKSEAIIQFNFTHLAIGMWLPLLLYLSKKDFEFLILLALLLFNAIPALLTVPYFAYLQGYAQMTIVFAAATVINFVSMIIADHKLVKI